MTSWPFDIIDFILAKIEDVIFDGLTVARHIVTPGFKGKSECKNTCAPGSKYTRASTQ
jgi:hypothetical protein